MKLYKNSGFSLIELLLVMSIISIVLSIGIPMVSSLGNSKSRLTYSVNHFLKDIPNVRNTAMLRHGTVYLILDPNSRNRYAVYTQRTPGDQPGQKTPAQLSNWLYLEDNIFFSEYHYISNFNAQSIFEKGLPQLHIDTNKVPSLHTGIKSDYPYIAFDSFGATLHKQDVILGFVMVSSLDTNDVVETPEGNRRYIVINAFMTAKDMGDFTLRRNGDKIEIMPNMAMFDEELPSGEIKN